MSYSVSDSINGRAIDIAYGAVQLPLPRGVAGRRRTRMVRQHLADNRAKYALVVQGESDTETWWAGDRAGVSIAAAIETWLDGEQETVPGFRVMIPLDTAVYVAQVRDRLVEEERILPVARAGEELGECLAQGTVVYAYEGGTLKDAVARHVPLEPLPFDPFGYAYAPAWKVFGRNAMVHPVHVLAVAVLAAACLGFSASVPTIERHARLGWNLAVHYLPFGQDEDSLLRNAPPTVITPQVDHAGAGQLRTLAKFLAGVESLYRDGLASLTYSGGSVILAGKSAYPWPAAARAYAVATGSSWSYSPAGWSIGQPVPVATDLRLPDLQVEEGITRLAGQAGFTLLAGPDAVTAPASVLDNTVTRTIHRTTWQVDYGSTAIGALLEGADRLDNLPVSLRAASCTFGAWQIQQCSLSLEVKTL